jgi:predicted transcriptional regulator YheO
MDPSASGRDDLTFSSGERAHAALVVDLLRPVIPALNAALGPNSETVLHNLTMMPHTIAAISGNLTGREVGGPPTDLGLRTFQAGWTDHLIGYRSELPDGTVMRSSSVFFHAPSGKSVVCLCVNVDISALQQAEQVLRAMTTTNEGAGPLLDAVPSETYPRSVESLGDGILAAATASVGMPVEMMKKPQKLEVVRTLSGRGFFTLRGSVDHAANHLQVSRFTVYNYLNELNIEPPSKVAKS